MTSIPPRLPTLAAPASEARPPAGSRGRGDGPKIEPLEPPPVQVGNNIVDNDIAEKLRATAQQQRAEAQATKEAGLDGIQERVDEIRQAITEQLEKASDPDSTSPRVISDYHEQTGRYVIRVVDANTDETIREFPPTEYLETLETLEKIAGMYMDEEA